MSFQVNLKAADCLTVQHKTSYECGIELFCLKPSLLCLSAVLGSTFI